MRVHLLGCPNTRTTSAYPLCGFSTRTLLFAKLLKNLGHYVILYGVAENEAPCDEFVSCLSAEEQKNLIGEMPYQSVPFDLNALFLTFNTRAARHVQLCKQPGDVLATIAGSASRQVHEHNPELDFLEYSIGYRGVTAPYRVYQSHVWRHVVHGYTGIDGGREFDDVIYPWFEVTDFPFVETPKDYVVYCGRLVTTKGIQVACQAAERAGVPLVVIGFGDPALVTYGQFVGAITTPERNRIISEARACIMPTLYLEPFGNVAAEAQLCGTPVISTNYGGFVESVEQGRTGYRCSSLGEFTQAMDLCAGLDRRYIRARAEALYSMQAAAVAYRRYFDRLATVHTDGFTHMAASLNVFEDANRGLYGWQTPDQQMVGA